LLNVSKQYKHVLTHQHLYARFYTVKYSKIVKGKWQKIPLSQLSDYALPRLIEKFTNDCDLKEIL
jgi:adenine-specific DNA glycosylase